MELERKWDVEQIYFDGDEYFASLEAAILGASLSVTVEVYLFDYDPLGKRLVAALQEVAKRGVLVRVIVDSIGSFQSKRVLSGVFADSAVQFQVYHELPWERSRRGSQTAKPPRLRVQWLYQLNKRNHRKVFVVDDKIAWLGGMNISSVHLRSLKGKDAWRDTGVMVRGDEVHTLSFAFERLWVRKDYGARLSRSYWRAGRVSRKSSLVRLNYNRRLRRRNYRELVRRLKRAEQKIWITAAYFVPNRKLLHTLVHKAKAGVDVRVLLPSESDVFFMPWVQRMLYPPLLEAGVKVYEYLPSVLHAKTVVVDQWCFVGSSNFNHRSLIHDLEVDVVLTHQEAHQAVLDQFLQDVTVSHQVTLAELPHQKWWQWVIGRLAQYLRYWL